MVAFYHSPIGWLRIQGGAKGIETVTFTRRGSSSIPVKHPILQKALKQLDQYFNDSRKRFSVPLCSQGTHFQKTVWEQIDKISYGQTRSYRDIASQSQNPRAMRAVGQAAGTNPIVIFTPCHRVISHSGKLGGYSCGKRRKQWLLKHESLR